MANKLKYQTTTDEQARTLFLNSVEFSYAWRALESRVKNGRHVLPAIVYGAFTVELYLKTLASIDHGRYAITHDLLILHDDLKRPTRDALFHQYQRHETIPSVCVYTLKDPTKPWTPPNKLSLREILEFSNSAFEAFRYPHGKVAEGFIAGHVIYAAHALVLKLKPAWDYDPVS